MPPPRTGCVEPHGDHFDVRIRLGFGKSSKLSPRECLEPSLTREQAKAEAAELQRMADAQAPAPPPPAATPAERLQRMTTESAPARRAVTARAPKDARPESPAEEARRLQWWQAQFAKLGRGPRPLRRGRAVRLRGRQAGPGVHRGHGPPSVGPRAADSSSTSHSGHGGVREHGGAAGARGAAPVNRASVVSRLMARRLLDADELLDVVAPAAELNLEGPFRALVVDHGPRVRLPRPRPLRTRPVRVIEGGGYWPEDGVWLAGLASTEGHR